MADQNDALNLLELAADITSAWLSNSNTHPAIDEVPAFLRKIYGAIVEISGGDSSSAAPELEYVPAVTARKSLA